MRSMTEKEKLELRNPAHKRIYCPHCGSRIIDAAVDTDSQVRAVGPFDPWPADYYTKCRVCKSEIGLKKSTDKSNAVQSAMHRDIRPDVRR